MAARRHLRAAAAERPPSGRVSRTVHELPHWLTALTRRPVSPAFYNAGSALTVLLFILLACAGFFFFRARRRRSLLQHHLSAGGRTGSALPLTRRDPLLSSSFEEREPLDRPYSPSGFANVGQPPRINTPGGYSPTSGGGGGHRSTLSVGSSQGGGGRGSPRFSKKGRTVLDEGSEGDVVFDLGDSGSDDDAAVGTQRAGRSS